MEEANSLMGSDYGQQPKRKRKRKKSRAEHSKTEIQTPSQSSIPKVTERTDKSSIAEFNQDADFVSFLKQVVLFCNGGPEIPAGERLA